MKKMSFLMFNQCLESEFNHMFHPCQPSITQYMSLYPFFQVSFIPLCIILIYSGLLLAPLVAKGQVLSSLLFLLFYDCLCLMQGQLWLEGGHYQSKIPTLPPAAA